MPDWVRHVVGVLGLSLPISGLLIHWQSWWELFMLWTVIVFSGGGLLFAFFVESWWEEHSGRRRSEEREQVLIEQLKGVAHEQGK